MFHSKSARVGDTGEHLPGSTVPHEAHPPHTGPCLTSCHTDTFGPLLLSFQCPYGVRTTDRREKLRKARKLLLLGSHKKTRRKHIFLKWVWSFLCIFKLSISHETLKILNLCKEYWRLTALVCSLGGLGKFWNSGTGSLSMPTCCLSLPSFSFQL